jgi:hypothetical protein
VIYAKSIGNFKDTTKFLEFMQSGKLYKDLNRFGQMGVDALASATPRDSGLTASSWGYQTGYSGTTFAISWYNTDIENGANVAVFIQYGHGTGTGGYVPGIDYINPAIRPVFDATLDYIWRQVTNG